MEDLVIENENISEVLTYEDLNPKDRKIVRLVYCQIIAILYRLLR